MRSGLRSCGFFSGLAVGFTAAISVGQAGQQLTEMGELAAAGAAAFTDDGRPVASAGLMRRALEYNAITGRRLALHCEEPSLTRGGHMHMGSVSAELGLGGWPSLGESPNEKVVIDLAALERQTQPEFGPVRRYIDTIKLQRGDFNGRVLSVRSSDVWAMAAMATVDPGTFVHTLERLNVLKV